MLPEFPKFKKLELTDKQDIEAITSKHEPFSDFNFVSMWSWDIKDEMEVSKLNGNLLVRFTDYLTGEPFYSFLGTNKVNETVKTLLDFSIEKQLKPKLSLIPSDSVEQITKDKFNIEEDQDNFDYIYDLNQISNYVGSQFSSQRNKVKYFMNRFPDARIEILNLQDKKIQAEVIELDRFWSESKIKKDINFKIKNELLATERFFQGNFHDALGVRLYFPPNILAGYSIFSILPNNKAISHFCKANIEFKGVYEHLVKECAKILIDKGCKYLNYEQDLGLPGLRESKRSFVDKFLKKYTIGFPSGK